MNCGYSEQVIMHIAHDSKHIPPDLRNQFLLSDEELDKELLLMTDAGTRHLFNALDKHKRMVTAPVSRLVVDVERFADDEQEIMSQKGMGVIYTKTADGRALRRPLQKDERDYLIRQYYDPHHKKLTREVDHSLNLHGRCLVLDGHSFPSKPLPYESHQSPERPDICIGTDPYHTTAELRNVFVQVFQDAGYKVAVDVPFSGSIVPGKYYKCDGRVQSVMVEVNRKLYMDESKGSMLESFDATAEEITRLCIKSIDAAYA